MVMVRMEGFTSRYDIIRPSQQIAQLLEDVTDETIDYVSLFLQAATGFGRPRQPSPFSPSTG